MERKVSKAKTKQKKEIKSYAIYKGDQFLYLGSKKECALYLNVKEQTILYYTTNAYKQRGKENNNRLIIIEIK